MKAIFIPLGIARQLGAIASGWTNEVGDDLIGRGVVYELLEEYVHRQRGWIACLFAVET